jgi:hypothetical protein
MLNRNTLRREIGLVCGYSGRLKIGILPETQISQKYRYIDIWNRGNESISGQRRLRALSLLSINTLKILLNHPNKQRPSGR